MIDWRTVVWIVVGVAAINGLYQFIWYGILHCLKKEMLERIVRLETRVLEK